MSEDRDKDKSHSLSPIGKRTRISIDQIKSLYIAEGKTSSEIADITGLTKIQIDELIKKDNLPELRNSYIRNGLQNIQNKQMAQAEQLMDIESNFKKLRIIQLQNQLTDYVLYFERHGDFYKRHPTSGEILVNTNGMRMQLSLIHI